MNLDHVVLSLEGAARVVLSEMEQHRMLRHVLPTSSGPIALAFGPEGGWKEQELAKFEEAGWTAASLGRSVLRAETAVIAAVAIAAGVYAT